MPVPWETLLPFGVMGLMFSASYHLTAGYKYVQSGGKRWRWNLDDWDNAMMVRDRRLTGYLRGQIDNVHAPPGFELNNPWHVQRKVSHTRSSNMDPTFY